ncbi:MAG: 2-succinyl-5-enolpyruvyl-6-hydroxy-3-cyclohexene-carboxylic-acid synthase [Deltaproteobacteria bacterium]|nr:2-succinyl-5-enolpyruvyl-6-hydroxy-3-cyclohexene-carboxylic-acid synthase [Deltaproteobacteria bacterium]
MSAEVQTIWAELVAATLVDAGITVCVTSPGSRSTPLVAALAATEHDALRLVTIIDERAAAFFALGVARATGKPACVVCTSGTAAAHYLPAVIEASMAGVPLVVVTADRPPELQDCGASQTIAQRGLYGGFVRGAYDLGAPVASEASLRAVRRTVIQAITMALGPCPGPVHVNVPLRKPLEPARPVTGDHRVLAQLATALRGPRVLAPPRLVPDPAAIAELASAISVEPRGVIVVGAMPVELASAREAVFGLAVRTGYPLVAEAGSQLRFGPRPARVVFVDHLDLVPADRVPAPALVLQLGAEPVAASWPGWVARTRPARWILAGSSWRDPDSTARGVILGDVAHAVSALAAALAPTSELPTRTEWLDDWCAIEQQAEAAVDRALEAHPGSESAVVRAALGAMPDGAILQIGNSLPIRVVDQVARTAEIGRHARRCAVITQRGAAGIDGLIASAAGATTAGRPVLLVLGDVSFAHDIGGLLAARCAAAPLAILVIDNRGGQIFAGLPVARADLGAAFDRYWLTAPELDPATVARAFGASAITAGSAAATAAAVTTALATAGVTVIHAPVTTSGAHDVRRTAIELYPQPALGKLGGDP